MFDIFEDYARQAEQEEKKSSDGSAAGSVVSSQSYGSYSSGETIYAVSVGGSLLIEQKPSSSQIAKLAEKISSLHREGYKFALVVGGGKVARNYAASAKALGANNFVQDELGIMITRANALLLVQALEAAHEEVLTDVKKAKHVLEQGKIPVFGGLMPSFTTDAVAALVAEELGGVFVNLTNVDGIYSLDPNKSPRAKFFETLSYDKLLSLMKLSESKPAQNIVLDLPCCLILKRSRIKGIVMNGFELENFEAMLKGQDFRGTVIEEPYVTEEEAED
ncbi:MAG: UMP kinase [Candidatus Diapherotrites archaeon]|uniref:Uridylate kinase n=1 Tax=Candidatus Iainarchaeum sp. TaxID=3101447 RepID=A0A8T4L0W8_9ARCH|nr:MAG: uridylate kinase [archaeon GW2011_AR10]MBS3059129.1 UMP kinase [Candidatus Diapherotrites archaeon]